MSRKLIIIDDEEERLYPNERGGLDRVRIKRDAYRPIPGSDGGGCCVMTIFGTIVFCLFLIL